jgi:hypothetical protein
MMRFAAYRLVVLACVACGSVKGGQLPDAPEGDASIDAPVRGLVKVTVLDPSGTGAPAVGANVVFLDPDGTMVKKASTDTNGAAEASVLPGASVTSVVLNNMSYQIQTVLAAKPGDNLVLGVKNGDGSMVGTLTVAFPSFTGATSYVVVGPCGTAPVAGSPATLTIFNSCKQAMAEIVVVPHDANGPMSSISKVNVPFVTTTSTTITGSYQGLRTLTSSFTNINPLVTTLSMTRAIPDASGFASAESISTPGATAVMTVTGPQGVGGQLITTATIASRSLQNVRQNVSGMAATYGLDIGATLLPWINTATYDAAAGKIVIPIDGTGTSNAKPDMVRIAASYRRTDANNVTTFFSWVMFAPEAVDLVLPALPPDLAGIKPTASDAVTITSAAMLEADTVSGYDALRNDLNGAFALYTSGRPPAGTVRFSRGPIVRAPL